MDGGGDVDDVFPEAFDYDGREWVPKDVVRVRVRRSVTVIPASAFEDCKKLRRVRLPEGLLRIEEWAFHRCASLEGVDLPSTLVHVGEYAFHWCKRLRTVRLPGGLSRVDKCAFNHCESLEGVVIPPGLREIAKASFGYCGNLKSAHFPEGLEKIDEVAFFDCVSLESAELPSTLVALGAGSFRNCPNLASVRLHEGLGSMGEGAFGGRFPRLRRFRFSRLEERLQRVILNERTKAALDGRIEEISAAARGGGEAWTACREGLERIHGVVDRWELRDAASTLELALWKETLEEGEEVGGLGRAPPSREERRVMCGADVVMREVIKFFAFRREW